MKNKNRNVGRKHILKLCVFLVIVFFVFEYNYYRIVPDLQDEYVREGISKEMHSIFDEYRQSIPNVMKEQKIPGFSVAVVDCNGILWSAGFGYTDYDRDKPVTSETIFAIMSTTKTFTATAVMIAVQERMVDLDTPISEYLPNFKINSRHEENPQNKITIRHLLNHTSGIDHSTTIGNDLETTGVTFEEHINSIQYTWLKHKVGVRSSYSTAAYDLVGYILQLKSGKPFPQYIKEKIFEPLKMTASSADSVFIKNHANRAVGHFPHVKECSLDIPVPAGGGIFCSANDLARFVQFHLNYGRLESQRFLSEDLIKQMYVPSPTSRRYGLGIEYYGKRGRGHGGAGYGFGSVMVWAPDYGIGALILANEWDPFDNYGQHKEVAYSIIRRLLDEKIVEKVNSFIEQAKEIEQISYQLPDTSKFTPYKPAWKKYKGTYQHMSKGIKLRTYARIALALGYPDPAQVKVYEKDGFLEIDGRPLDEHLPGLFFSADGYCLDFRGPVPTWQNLRMKKNRY